MKSLYLTMGLLLAGSACFAQQWEVGGFGGGAFLKGLTATNSAGATAKAGFETGAAFGGYFGQNLYKHLSGEVHYTFMQSNLQLTSGGTKATFAGNSHAVHYDLVYHTGDHKSRAQFFVAAGGGLRVFRGTGAETAYQALNTFALLTKTQELKPMGSVGGGVKVRLAKRLNLRLEVRDYITAFPKEVIAPAPGAKISGFLNQIVPMVGLSYEF
jgi:hypothetical protein